MRYPPRLPFLTALAGVWASAHVTAAELRPMDFNRDVRPILSDKCFKCHGPDSQTREADLRLDVRAAAIAEIDGRHPIAPGKPEASEVVHLIEATDPDDRMPPRKSNLRLSKEEIATLRRWIAEGAEYQAHWSLVAPKASPLPTVNASDWPRNPIDRFVLARLESENLAPTREADRSALLRRATLDLTGVPPSLEELDTFLSDASPQAYEKAVDRLLASPRFGERMAMDWLDAARYADTNGYFGDKPRQAWPWRDWVIHAFNRNLPFDQFTIEQLAGDLLPGATMEQKIATGFNRNHMVTNESGVIDEEYRVEYVADRIDTTATVWMGLTVGCARCHDHKFDPILQREYFQLFAFFNSGPEKGLVSADDPPPVLDVATAEERAELQKLSAARAEAETAFDRVAKELLPTMETWETKAASELEPTVSDLAAHLPFEPEPAGSIEKGNVVYEPGLLGNGAVFDAMQHVETNLTPGLEADQPWTAGIWLKPTGSLSCVLAKIEPGGTRRGFELLWSKGRFQVNLVNHWGVSAIETVSKDPARSGEWQHVIVSYDGSRRAAGLRLFVDGIETPLKVGRDTLEGSISNSEPLRIGRRDNGLGFYGALDEMRVYRRAVNDREARAWYWSDRLRGILAVAPEKRVAKQKKALLDYYMEHHADGTAQAAHVLAKSARQSEDAFRAQLPKTLVMQELAEPRATHILLRGEYSAPGEAVQPGVPASLPPLPPEAPRNRLGLARWLVSPSHPLTSRVAVNRFWQQCFGEGLVRTGNDFGAQGEAPSHPELLDWLAVRFVESGWDMKAMLRLIVTSATYRQSSAPTTALLQHDPENRLLGRGPRFRLHAEMIRDQALLASGLLVDRLGGPSVKPYQPPGLWEAVSYDAESTYQEDRGDGLWRRSLYTYWKRQSPPPTMLVFDGPTRETCSVRRPRTNTPLQSLVLLNDMTYMEAGRALAALALKQPGSDDDRLRFAFRRVTTRMPESEEVAVLKRLLEQQRARFQQEPEAAAQLLAIGASTAGRDLPAVEAAAWAATAHTLLNLDEVITRR